MKKLSSILILALVGLVSIAQADTLTATGVGNGTIMGIVPVYVSPYNGVLNVNGAQRDVLIICDDYFAVTPLNSPWQVELTNFADLATNLSDARWGGLSNALTRYQRAAWLSDQLFMAPNAAQQGYISYAIWGLFNTNALNNLTVSQRNAVNGWLTLAGQQSINLADYSHYSLATPNLSRPNFPQEFIVRTPEPGAIALLAVNLLGGVALVMFFRRRRLAAE